MPIWAKKSGLLAVTRELVCAWRGCRTPFVSRKPNARFCSLICSRRAGHTRKHLHKRSVFRQPTAPIRRARLAIFERDAWTCWLCLEAVDPALRWPDPGSASVDHVVPLSQGGADTPENLRLARTASEDETEPVAEEVIPWLAG